MMKELRSLLEYQIRCEMYLNEIQEDSLFHDNAISNCIDGWETILKLIYLRWPNLEGRYDIAEYINFVLAMIPELKSAIASEKDDWIYDNSEVLAGLIIDYCERNAAVVAGFSEAL